MPELADIERRLDTIYRNARIGFLNFDPPCGWIEYDRRGERLEAAMRRLTRGATRRP